MLVKNRICEKKNEMKMNKKKMMKKNDMREIKYTTIIKIMKIKSKKKNEIRINKKIKFPGRIKVNEVVKR